MFRSRPPSEPTDPKSIGDQIEQRAAEQFSTWDAVLQDVRRAERVVQGDRRHANIGHYPERRPHA